ncbi:MAG: hypothetical protein ACI4GW_00240 [Lachnospiraceae bacterium]
MMEFHFNNWLVYFYFYCIAGWIFESGNVSVRQKKWVNRGFMKGPWLPLYGSGALVILLSTLPFEQNPIAVYFVSAISATILEYITGVVMLKLFKVRYWDYRYRKIQFQGHICLVSTIVWGFLGLLMVYIIHPPVVKLVGRWNPEVVSIITFLITICIVYDFANSFREAMDLRGLITQAQELKERIEESLAEKRDELEQRMDDMREERKEQFEQRLELIEQRIADAREQRLDNLAEMEDALEQLKERLEQKSQSLLRSNPYASFHKLEIETEEIRKHLHIKWRK